ncbi:MAG: type III pantothenate kinase [Firmicutes bacterium]|nr:type III pantothenate kinase [Dethiobacter sp.]MBS3887992.1 type III pantothenate kinase [Bacillota bacterium]MBS4055254.1 type III pantothenate kinase [Thermaerobacter sp.]
MLFAIDVGNTNMVLGLYKEGLWSKTWRISTDQKRTIDEYYALISSLVRDAHFRPQDVAGVVLTNVVPPLQGTIEAVAERLFGREPLVVGAGVRTGMKIRTDNPREVGSDRIVNAVAALHLYGAPAIIVDFGTATTFDVLSPQGDYLGGAIAPGIGISAEALFLRASKLSRVELERPKHAIGKNTVDSMQSGLIFGYAGLVEGMVARLKSELGCPCKVIATGGLARVIAEETTVFDAINDNLTLEGLRLIYELNK